MRKMIAWFVVVGALGVAAPFALATGGQWCPPTTTTTTGTTTTTPTVSTVTVTTPAPPAQTVTVTVTTPAPPAVTVTLPAITLPAATVQLWYEKPYPPCLRGWHRAGKGRCYKARTVTVYKTIHDRCKPPPPPECVGKCEEAKKNGASG